MAKEIEGKLVYEQDSKHYHRFKIMTDIDLDVQGTVYFPKGSDELPDKVILERVKGPDTVI